MLGESDVAVGRMLSGPFPWVMFGTRMRIGMRGGRPDAANGDGLGTAPFGHGSVQGSGYMAVCLVCVALSSVARAENQMGGM